MPPDPVNGWVTDADKPDLRIWEAKQEPLRRRERFIAYFKFASVHVNGDHFAEVACFHLRTNLFFIKSSSALGVFYLAQTWLADRHGIVLRIGVARIPTIFILNRNLANYSRPIFLISFGRFVLPSRIRR